MKNSILKNECARRKILVAGTLALVAQFAFAGTSIAAGSAWAPGVSTTGGWLDANKAFYPTTVSGATAAFGNYTDEWLC